MRTRNKRYEDYGLSQTEAKAIMRHCRGKNFKEYRLLSEACVLSNPDICGYLAFSLLNGVSYDRMLYVPIGRDDFYGYRRKAIAFLWKKLVNNGKWRWIGG